MTTERITLAQFIEKHGITAAVKRVGSNPSMEDKTGSMRHFLVVLHMGEKFMSVHFSQGSAHTEAPTAQDVLSCLAMDSAGFENADNFEDWCGEYGYDTDSRRAERTYNARKDQAIKLMEFLGADAYDALLWETEQD
jgi:hypothetical protein